jgi:acyl transferase domain-containing protein
MKAGMGIAFLGSAVNQDGRSSSFTAPHGPSQQALILKALQQGMRSPQDVDYVSLHGTGTSLGDPIEVGAIGGMLQFNRSADSGARVLGLGSSKATIGHTESTAGLAGLLLACITLKSSLCSPFRFRNMNPYVSSALESWTSIAKAPIQQASLSCDVAGTSSFGMSGVNSHCLVRNAVNGVVQRPNIQGESKLLYITPSISPLILYSKFWGRSINPVKHTLIVKGNTIFLCCRTKFTLDTYSMRQCCWR